MSETRIGFDIDAMPPDELRRRLRDALAENEALRRRLENGTKVTINGWSVKVDEAWKVPSAPKESP
jgi:hypothetical protein